MDVRLDSMPDLSTVYSLIKSLYCNEPNGESKEMSSKSLELIQQSIYGWKIADQLLLNNADISSCYFAAQTLRTKIQNNFHELPEDSYVSLKDSIVKHLKVIDESVVQKQLCLSITYLALLVPNWTNPIEELATQVPNASILVEILICLAEELEGSRNTIKVDIRRRQAFNDYLKQISPQVIHLLNTSLNEAKSNWRPSSGQKEEKTISKVYECLGAWLHIMDNSDINLIEPILSSVFESLRNADCPTAVHDYAANTVCSAAIVCEEYTKYQQMTHYLLNQVYDLEPAYHYSVAKEDTTKTENYTRIFTEMAESIVDPLIINEVDLKLLHLLLNCVGHYDCEILEITFHFWYRFSEYVFKRKATAFNGVCNRLLAALTKHCQPETDSEGLIDSRSDLYDLRCRIKDLVREVITTVGVNNYILGNNILDTIKTVNAWEVVEANLFMISCIIGERNAEEDNQLVADIISLALNYSSVNPNSQHIQIYATICSILGELSDWLKYNPVFLDSILNFLLNMIANFQKNEELSACAAQSLQTIIESCASQHLVGNANLVSILIQICCRVDFIKNEEAANNLLQCCAAIISTTSEHQDQLVAQLLTPHLEKLQELVNNKSNFTHSAVYFDRIAAIFRKLRLTQESLQSQLLIPLITDQLWPLASIALTANAATNPQLIERCCRCIRFLIRCFRPAWLLQPIVNQIVPLYQQFPKHSSFLYLGSILVDEFANEQDKTTAQGLINMLNEFSMTTFKLLCDSQLRLHPDTIDDFFRLCTRTLQKCSNCFLTNNMLDNILNLTLASIQLDHREANNSVVKFVIELIDGKYSKELIDKILMERFGQRLMDAVVNATLFHLPTYLVAEMSDILWSLMQWNPDLVKLWLAHSLKTIPQQNNTTIMTATPEQLEEFYTNCIKSSSPKLIASSFRYLARLYR
ncbi:unnamed protein product [Oppiella nova]|uniref:Transportin-3 n=1 Tax=Oppiella nova TaxID=334625 RepID=A0A7R9QMY1_9ACAR|nr:unnamed protein product [Oppiella nova]CAG2168202.1 unnamed protein product [Oppiella nova]